MTEEEIKKNLGHGKDLRGIKFNKLTPLYPLKERKKRFIVWHCKCDCGNECDVIGSHLISGHTKSCGCYQKEKATLLGQNKIKDLSNQKFGNLTVIKRNGTYVAPNGNTSPIYLCKCDCGNECGDGGLKENLIPMMFLMNQTNGEDKGASAFDMSNPLLLMALMQDKGGSESNDFFTMMILGQMMKSK